MAFLASCWQPSPFFQGTAESHTGNSVVDPALSFFQGTAESRTGNSVVDPVLSNHTLVISIVDPASEASRFQPSM